MDKAGQLNVPTDPGQFQRVAESCRKRTLTVEPRSHEYDSRGDKKMILLLKLACSTDIKPVTLSGSDIKQNEKFCPAKMARKKCKLWWQSFFLQIVEHHARSKLKPPWNSNPF